MRRVLLTSAGWLVMTTVAMAQVALGGRWGIDAAACADRFSPEVMEFDVKAQVVRYYESACRLSDVTAIGTFELVWQMALSCSGEGMTWETQRIYALEPPWDGNGPMRLIEIDLVDGFAVSRVLCP